jgi:hypothetical protein
LALFDAQVLAGKRWYKLEGDDSAKISSQELSVAAHLDPIPLVPVAFGLRATAGALTSDEVKSAYSMSKVDAAAVTSLGLDVLAWIPLVPVFTPYIRATIPVSATWGVKGDAAATVAGQSVYLPFAQTSSISGPELSLGAKFSLLPLIKFSVEVNQASQKIKPEEVKINNVKVSDAGETVNLKSNALLLGIEVGL